MLRDQIPHNPVSSPRTIVRSMLYVGGSRTARFAESNNLPLSFQKNRKDGSVQSRAWVCFYLAHKSFMVVVRIDVATKRSNGTEQGAQGVALSRFGNRNLFSVSNGIKTHQFLDSNRNTRRSALVCVVQ